MHRQSEGSRYQAWERKVLVGAVQDPVEVDAISKIHKDLDDTMVVLHQTIDGVLARGVKLEDLVERSNDLSNSSKLFYKTSRKMNYVCPCVIA
jgi:synaptobrevin family protein YKT6